MLHEYVFIFLSTVCTWFHLCSSVFASEIFIAAKLNIFDRDESMTHKVCNKNIGNIYNDDEFIIIDELKFIIKMNLLYLMIKIYYNINFIIIFGVTIYYSL